jgi:hypothetical protein
MKVSSRSTRRGSLAVLVTAVHAGFAVVVMTSSVGAFAAPWRETTPTGAARPGSAVSARPASVGVPPAAFGPAHRVLVVGDSLAESLLPGLETAASADGVQLFSHAFGGCGLLTGLPLDLAGQPYPFSQACNDSRPGWQTQGVQDLQPDLVLWLGAAWDERDHIVNGTIAQLGTIAGDRIFLQLIDEAAQRLTATGARLVIVTPPPERGTQLAADPTNVVRLAALNRLLRLYAALHQIQIVDLAPVICPGGGPACPEAVNGVVMRPDGYHIGPSASPVVASQVLPQALGIAPDPQSASPTTADTFARLAQRVPSAAAWAEISHPWRPPGEVTGVVARRG